MNSFEIVYLLQIRSHKLKPTIFVVVLKAKVKYNEFLNEINFLFNIISVNFKTLIPMLL